MAARPGGGVRDLRRPAPVLLLLRLLLAAALTAALVSNAPTSLASPERVPRPDPAACPGRHLDPVAVVNGLTLCTPGPDRPPARHRPGGGAGTEASAGLSCVGDGSDGNRVEVLYVIPPGNTFATEANVDRLIRTTVQNADAIFNASAAETGGVRHVRWLMDSSCNLVVHTVTVSATGYSTFAGTVTELAAKGYDRADRKYLVLMQVADFQTSPICSIATTLRSDTASPSTNLNNTSTGYARLDNGGNTHCWGGSVAAHELMHTLGGVQPGAPHGTTYHHCRDEYDRMCENDGSGPAPAVVCADPAHENRFDCNHDDYFTTATPPVGSYLATHWNTADSAWLTTVEAPTPPPNDSSANPTMMPDLVSPTQDSSTGVTVDATWEPGEQDPSWLAGTSSRRSIWYRFTSRVTGLVDLDTVGSDFDTWLAVYGNCTCGVGDPIAHNDNIDASTTQSRIALQVQSGQTYYVQVDGHTPAAGNVVLNRTMGALPTAPTSPSADAGHQRVTVRWSPPISEGSSPIRYYRVSRNNTTVYQSPDATARSFVDNGVTNGTTYTYAIRAANATGESEAASVQAVPSTVPGVPRSLVATPGDTQVQLSWLRPASNGGSAVTGYRLYRDGTLLAGAVTGTSYTDDNLANAVPHSYEVAATNLNGEGPHTVAVSATPNRSGVDGTVTGAGGTAVPGAWAAALRAADLTLAGGAVADASGHYQLDLAPGSYYLEFVDPSGAHGPEWFDGRPSPSTFGELTAVPVAAARRSRADASLIPSTGTLGGRVTEDGAGPLSGVLVVAIRNWVTVAGTVTDTEGSYHFASLPAGGYRLVFADPTAGHQPEFFDGRPGPDGATTVTVTGGGAVAADAGLAATPPPAHETTVRGTITDQSTGSPIAGTYVIAHARSNLGLVGAAPTGADGRYQIDVPAGDFYVEVFDPGGRYRREWFDDVPNPATLADLSLVAGGDSANAALTPTAGSLRGAVTVDATHAPLAGAWVVAIGPSGIAGGTVTDADGSYRIDGLAGGFYSVVFADPSGAHAAEFFDDQPDPSHATPVAVDSGVTTTVDAGLF